MLEQGHNNKKEIRISTEMLPKDFPELLLKRLYKLTGREYNLKVKSFKLDFFSFDVWFVLRSIYISFKTHERGFKYYNNFRWPEVFSLDEILEHLLGMLNKYFQGLIPIEVEFDWHHLRECEFHFMYFQLLVFSFLETIQGLNFESRFYKKIDRLVEITVMDSLKEMHEKLKRAGIIKELMPFTSGQQRMLGIHFLEWGQEKSRQFFERFIVPELKKNKYKHFSDQEILVYIAAFECE